MSRLLTITTLLLMFLTDVYGQSGEWAYRGELDPEVRQALDQIFENSIQPEGIETALSLLHTEGYLLAAIFQPDSTNLIIAPGERYQWTQLSAGNLSGRLISQSGFRPGRYSTTPVSERRLEKLFTRILEISEREGYPFANVRLDSIRIINSSVSASILHTPGPQIVYDSLAVTGNARIKPAWLQVYLQLELGDLYDQRNIDRIERRISQLSFVRLTGQPALQFVGNKVIVNLPLEHVPSNRIDGVVGFLPNEDEGLRITGQAELSLSNLFNSGKSFDFFWQRMRPETQLLDIAYYHTNLIRTPLDVGLKFHLLKEDTTFINRDFSVSLNYRTGDHTLYFLSKFKSSRLLETSRYQDITELPEVSDFNLNDYGVGYEFQRLTPGWLNRNGWRLQAEGALGNKKIRQNAGLPEEVYEGIDFNSLQGRASLHAHVGFRLGKRSLIYQNVHGGFIRGSDLFLNDLYRLGGFMTLRGFNENQFFAQNFIKYTLEYQWYLGESSNFFLFLDQAWLQSLESNDNPTGIGLGTTLQTGGGLLQLVYAVGRSKESGFDIRSSRLHFGFIASF